MGYVAWQNVMGVEDNQFLLVGGGVRVVSLGQSGSVDQLLAVEHFPGKNLTQQEFLCPIDVVHAVLWILTEVYTLTIPASVSRVFKTCLP